VNSGGHFQHGEKRYNFKKCGILRLAERLTDSVEGLCSMQLFADACGFVLRHHIELWK
jgi:hypothetical protein